jgi:hypothetical protein
MLLQRFSPSRYRNFSFASLHKPAAQSRSHTLAGLQSNRNALPIAPLCRGLHTALHASFTCALAPHFVKLAQLREAADARQALGRGDFRAAIRESERISDISSACRDVGMQAAAAYFRASVLSLSGLWDAEAAQLHHLRALASSTAEFHPHFKTAVSLLLSSAEIKCSGAASVVPSEEDASAGGMLYVVVVVVVQHVTCDCRSTRNLVAAAASLCSGNAHTPLYSAAAAAAAANGERAVDCYARLLHATALLNSGDLQAAEAQVNHINRAAFAVMSIEGFRTV